MKQQIETRCQVKKQGRNSSTNEMGKVVCLAKRRIILSKEESENLKEGNLHNADTTLDGP